MKFVVWCPGCVICDFSVDLTNFVVLFRLYDICDFVFILRILEFCVDFMHFVSLCNLPEIYDFVFT